MNREVHVRFWESPEVKVLRATRHLRTIVVLSNALGAVLTCLITELPAGPAVVPPIKGSVSAVGGRTF